MYQNGQWCFTASTVFSGHGGCQPVLGLEERRAGDRGGTQLPVVPMLLTGHLASRPGPRLTCRFTASCRVDRRIYMETHHEAEIRHVVRLAAPVGLIHGARTGVGETKVTRDGRAGQH